MSRLVVRRSSAAIAIVAALALGVAACNNDDDKSDATTTTAKTTTTAAATTTTGSEVTTTSSGTPTTTQPAGVNIPTFDVPSTVNCTSGGTFSVPATWTTTPNVQAVDYTIDGQAPGAQAGLPTNGGGNLGPIPCDGQPHEVTFYAYADANASTSVSRTVTGRPS